MGSGRANYLELLKKNRKTLLFRPYIELFRGKKSIIHNNQWRERKDIILKLVEDPASRGKLGRKQARVGQVEGSEKHAPSEG